MSKALMIFTLLIIGCDNRECIKSHVEQRHQNSWVQVVLIGKGMMSLVHPARDYQVEVCDEYKEVKGDE